MTDKHPTIAEIMNALFAGRVPGLPVKGLAEVFERLTWCLVNAEEVQDVRADWLRGDLREKVEIALAMEETFPFKKRAELVAAMNQIASRWPDLRTRCEELVKDWDSLGVKDI